MSRILLGEILIEKGYISSNILDFVLKKQEEISKTGDTKKIGEILIDDGYIEEGILFDALVVQKDRRL